MKLSTFLDIAVFGIIIVYFVGFLSFEYAQLGISKPLFSIPYDWKILFDVLVIPLTVVLTCDLVLKYKNTKNPKKFVKKYWIDLVMLVMIPIFSSFKILKIGLSTIKKLKTMKMATKSAHKTKKIFHKSQKNSL